MLKPPEYLHSISAYLIPVYFFKHFYADIVNNKHNIKYEQKQKRYIHPKYRKLAFG